MAGWPLHVVVKSYSGKDPKKKFLAQQERELARKIEEYINANVAEGEVQTFNYGDLASILGYDKEAIKKLLYATDAGSNGITVGRAAKQK